MAQCGLNQMNRRAIDAIQADVHRTFTLQVTRDGKTFPIIYVRRGDAVDAYQWERISGISEDACKAPVGLPE